MEGPSSPWWNSVECRLTCTTGRWVGYTEAVIVKRGRLVVALILLVLGADLLGVDCVDRAWCGDRHSDSSRSAETNVPEIAPDCLCCLDSEPAESNHVTLPENTSEALDPTPGDVASGARPVLYRPPL